VRVNLERAAYDPIDLLLHAQKVSVAPATDPTELQHHCCV